MPAKKHHPKSTPKKHIATTDEQLTEHVKEDNELLPYLYQQLSGVDEKGWITGEALDIIRKINAVQEDIALTLHTKTDYDIAHRKEPIATAYQAAADELGVTVAALRAVALTETGGDPYDSEGTSKILFERHLFSIATGGIYDESHPGISNPISGGYGKYSAQYGRLEEAKKLDEEAAYASVSVTAYQILGSNYAEAGNYTSAKQFVEAMERATPEEQLTAFKTYLSHHPDEIKALQKQDWAGFAKPYNGSGYKKNNYDTKMKANYEHFKNAPLKGLVNVPASELTKKAMGAPPAPPAKTQTQNSSDLTYLTGHGLPGDRDFVPSVFDANHYKFIGPTGRWLPRNWADVQPPEPTLTDIPAMQPATPYQGGMENRMIYSTMPQAPAIHKKSVAPNHGKTLHSTGSGGHALQATHPTGYNIIVKQVVGQMVDKQHVTTAGTATITADDVATLLRNAANSTMA